MSVTGCSLWKGRPKNKPKPTRGLDLEEVRRRTSLLSGESRAPVPTSSRQAAAAPRPAAPSSYFDAGWGRQHAPPPSSEVPHPLHAAATSPPVEAEGNYFNEEFLRAREPEGREGGRVMEQAPRGGDRLMDSAGSFLTSARSVALVLPKRRIAGCGANKSLRICLVDQASPLCWLLHKDFSMMTCYNCFAFVMSAILVVCGKPAFHLAINTSSRTARMTHMAWWCLGCNL